MTLPYLPTMFIPLLLQPLVEVNEISWFLGFPEPAG